MNPGFSTGTHQSLKDFRAAEHGAILHSVDEPGWILVESSGLIWNSIARMTLLTFPVYSTATS